MKKLLLSLGLIGIFGGLVAFVSASSTSCKDVEFSNGVTACVNIEDAGTDRRSLTTSVDNGSTSLLRCDIMTPNSALRSIPQCNGEFSYDKQKAGRIKLWIRYSESAPTDREGKPSNNSERTYPQWVYDFDNEERAEDDLTDEDTNNNNDNFYITASPSSPDQDEAVDITVEARDSSNDTNDAYRGTVRFKVERKSGSSRVSASSSLYDLNRTSYTFTSSDNGEHDFSNLVTFNDDSYDYRLVVYDNSDSGIEGTKTFSLNGDGNNNNYNTDNFYVTTDDSTPSLNQLVDLTVKARDGTSTDTSYRGKIEFEVRYRASGNTNRTKTTSLSYYEMKYPYKDNGYTFNSSNNGNITITNFIRFRRTDYEYKVIVMDTDDNDIEGYRTFTVGTVDSNDNYDTDNFYMTTDDSTPSTSQRVDLTVKARYSTTTDTAYRGTVQFEVYYKSSSSSTWTKTTSSTYYEMKSPYEDDGYTFTSSNAGSKTFTDLIRFKKTNYSYKVLAYDEDDESIEGYKTFNVGTTSSSSSVDGFTTSELNTVRAIYDARPNMIDNLESAYSALRRNTRRQTMSDDLYDEMELILDDDNDRIYSDFDEFYSAFSDRYRYTVSAK